MNLRDRLRTGTRRAQDSAAQAYGRLDVSGADGLAAFLSAHLDTVAALLGAKGKAAPPPAMVTARAALDADLAALGRAADPVKRRLPDPDDAVAREWLWHAMQMGLRPAARDRAIAADTDPALGDAGHYLSLPRDVAGFRTLCSMLEAEPGYGAQADRILAAANAWFVLFETAAHDRARR
ncbi:hypothetical protein JSE7799_01369 [Jannaschia seosinensis]|uniref:Heme oxygenase n=1 Tax=Jannaschia seosinensis TaxID=313367 RepID=A0A0M7BA17_9RHOB|nr:hypothetical protein [Jannaschia seosinensis]CUH38148.1 hypothetical protein JSE7799_01369 [Jannaschia seosinensis]